MIATPPDFVPDCTISMLSVRHQATPGLESGTCNLISGLTAIGRNVQIAYSLEERISAEFLAFARTTPRIALSRETGLPGGSAGRFVEEILYANRRGLNAPRLYMNYFLPPSLRPRRHPVGVVIHDCQHRVLHHFTPRKRAWLDYNFARTLDHADRVYLISEFERSQIARFFGDRRAERCEVIYNSIDLSRYDQSPPSAAVSEWIKRPYLLAVAQQYPHKNTRKTIEAFALMCERDADTRLVLVGKPSPATRAQLETEVPEAVRKRVIEAGYVSDSDLGNLYRHAALFVTASSYEGFGMPAVEAMGLGAPILATRGTSLPEVTLGRGAYVPEEATPGDWADAMAACLASPPDASSRAESATMVREKYAPAAVAKRVADSLLR
ncbi:glycosyltransferase family 4 protein [Ancylobacter terrae]|uniref:glycosyltransferase family 4 protein n=1 Tax=Ancylobacter sp. sgz301288 TaxID=3342077 RepID=UPI00385C4D72